MQHFRSQASIKIRWNARGMERVIAERSRRQKFDKVRFAQTSTSINSLQSLKLLRFVKSNRLNLICLVHV